MALPGLSLPGLRPSVTHATPLTAASTTLHTAPTRVQTLSPQSEWRFECSFSQRYSVKLESGHAEMFGVELALKQTYTFSGCKGAIFTWQGCQLELSGEAESEYAGLETEYAVEWLNVHGMLEHARALGRSDGPRVLVVGPDCVGKSRLVQSVAAWAVRSGKDPTVINLDPREGLLAPPSSLTAVTLDACMDVENGYGIGPMSGPTVSPMRTPLIYQFPYASPAEKPDVYKAVATRMALSVMNRLEESPSAKRSGIIVDTPGALNDPKSSYDLIAHVVSEFSITVIVTMGSERLSSDLTRRFGGGSRSSPDESIAVLRIAKPGGAVERDPAFMKQLRTQQTRHYFFGSAKESLNPRSHSVPFADVTVFRAQSAHVAAAAAAGADDSFAPGADDSDVPDAPSAGLDQVAPTPAMAGALLAIKSCPRASDPPTVRDSPVLGFLYVADVDHAKQRYRFLAPHPQRWGDRALVWGHGWPEALPDLLT